MFDGAVLPHDDVFLRRSRIPLFTKAYFILNKSYKAWRINDGHNTQAPKVAALQCLAIATLQPFRPLDWKDAKTTEEARCNEIYALVCASAALNKHIIKNKSNFYLRLLDVLSEAKSSTLESFILDVEMGIDKPVEDYDIPFHDEDKPITNSLITIFELMSGTQG